MGLTSEEAAIRLRAEGPNALPTQATRTPLRIVLEILREPMQLLLVAGGVVYLALGDLQEAIILLVFASLSILITAVQETRTERVLEKLRDLTSPRALVIRDGERRRISGQEVVRGDLFVVSEGDRVPADGIVREAHDLKTDESLLTGESVPVNKRPVAADTDAVVPPPGGDNLPYIFSGSLVVRGRGLCEVTATGGRTELGRIGQSLRSLETEVPRLRAELRKVVKLFLVLGGVVSLFVVLLYGLTRGAWLDALLAGIAVEMSMLPEEFPVVLAVFMAMGAWRISQAGVLARRAMAIESLGSATVLCTDKTGTLTLNKMSVGELRLADGERYRPPLGTAEVVPDAFVDLMDTAILGSEVEPHDPMERAFHDLGRQHRELSTKEAPPTPQLKRAYGLRPELLAMSNAWRFEGADHALIAAKGSPEAIVELCHLAPETHARILRCADEMAQAGMRVLGVAKAAHPHADLPDHQHAFAFTFIGLVGLSDPLRPSVPDAIQQCRAAGIRVVMITGDYPATARTIAAQAGMVAGDIVTGVELDSLDEAQLIARLSKVAVFARILPAQKLRIIEALKAQGEVVAMTGDGVNDAPSLKAAHIGIAMGNRGSDVAREASALVLLDDDFGSIVKAIALGRRIYDNLRKAIGFIVAVHVPIAGLALLPLIFGFPLMLGPIHIAVLEMFIDPICSLAFEAETPEGDVMRRPPRRSDERMISRKLIGWGLLQGVLCLLVVAGVLVIARLQGRGEDEVRALSFTALVLCVLALILVNRSFGPSLAKALLRPNLPLVLVTAAVLTVLGGAMAVPWMQNLFRFAPISMLDLGGAAAAAVLVLALLEIIKAVASRRRQPTG